MQCNGTILSSMKEVTRARKRGSDQSHIPTNTCSISNKYILQFKQINLAIQRNSFCNSNKYILQFKQIHLVWYCPRWRKSREQVSEDQTKVTPTSPCFGSWHCHIHHHHIQDHQSYSRLPTKDHRYPPMIIDQSPPIMLIANHQWYLPIIFITRIVLGTPLPLIGWCFDNFPSQGESLPK